MPRDVLNSENILDFGAQEEYNMEHLDDIPDSVLADYLEKSRAFLLTREEKARLEKTESVLKKSLMELLDKFGDPYGPEGQHRTIQFPEPIRGIARMVRQAKVSSSVDEVAAEAVARRAGIYDRLFKPVMALDEGAVLVAVKEGILSDDDLNQIFPKKVVYAFVPEKEKK